MPRRRVLLALLPLTMTACFGVADKHSVLVKQVPANLAFGNPPPAAAGANPGQATTQYIQVPGLPGATVPANFFEHPNFNFPTGTPLGPCPDIQPGVFPADPQTPDIEKRPTAGTYTVRSNSAEQLTLATQVTKIPRKDPFLPRVIHDVKSASDASNSGAFSFLEDGALGFQLLDPKMTAGFLVRPSSTDLVFSQVQPPKPGVGPLPSPAPTGAPNTQQGTAPTDGVFLNNLQLTVSGTTFAFSAPVGVQLLQLPAANGLQWSSTAQDGANQTSISFNGGINPSGDPAETGVEDVNACGEPVRAYKVSGTLVLSGRGILVNDKVTFDVVTQYGGWIIRDTHSLGTAQFGAGIANDWSGSTFDLTLNHLAAGQLPAGVKP